MAEIKTHPCSTCQRPTIFAHRPEGGMVPLDPRGVVYFVGAMPDGKLVAKTAKEFLANVERIVLANGRELSPSAILGVYVTHFATCPQAGQHSKKGRGNA